MHLNQIQGGRWDDAIKRLFSMKQGAVSPTVAAEIVTNIILENDRPENMALLGTRLGSGQTNRGPTALEFTMGQLFNPVNSGVLVVCTSLIVAGTSTTTFVVLIGTTELDTAELTEVKTDTRLIDASVGASFRTTAVINRESAVAAVAGTTIRQIRLLANVSFDALSSPVILKPGFGLYVRPGVVNQNLIANWSWYERPLNPSEEFER